VANVSPTDLAYRRFVEGSLLARRDNRYSWWTHWRELADYFLPRRYRWLITPNMQSRGSPINQHILDSSGVFSARNLAAALLSGKCSPLRPWFRLKIDHIDSTQTTPVSLWLAECERLMYLVFAESNFYNSMAQFFYDLVIFGTAVLIIYEDHGAVINCYNPCAGEYYLDLDGKYRPVLLSREFTMTIGAVVGEFGYDNCSVATRKAYDTPDGSGRTREIIVAHDISPNDDGHDFGISNRYAYRECFWEWGGSTSPQSGSQMPPAFLRKRGYFDKPNIAVRWDLVSNDPYGRSPAMDGLGDQKQLQLETRRKAQAIDKMVNPPLVADIKLKNQPASLLPGGMTYIAGFAQSGKPAIGTIYDTKFPVQEIAEDLAEVRERLSKVFYNDLFQPISQYETRSNITATEIDARRAEAMIMIGPALERIDNEGLKPIIERVWGIMSRQRGPNGQPLLPPAPPEIAGRDVNIEFVSMLAQAQSAAESAGIERLFQIAGGLVGVVPEAMDNIDVDFALDKYSSLLNNDPRIIRSPQQLQAIRQKREQQAQAAQQAAQAEQLSAGAKTLSETDVGGGRNALQSMLGQ